MKILNKKSDKLEQKKYKKKSIDKIKKIIHFYNLFLFKKLNKKESII
jgi:hypothetical protein